MITLLRSSQRRHVRHGQRETWHSFSATEQGDRLSTGFGHLVAFDELMLPPGERTQPHVDDEAEMITYIHAGALSQEDSRGHSEVLHTGEFQRISTGHRIRLRETSVSKLDPVHVFRISLRPFEAELGRANEQKRFTTAERRNLLCIVASPDRRKGSLRVHQDALVYSALLNPGHHLGHGLERGRTAWVHIVNGEAILNEFVMTRGDAVAVSGEPSISLTVRATTELILIDLGPVNACPWERSSSETNTNQPRGGI